MVLRVCSFVLIVVQALHGEWSKTLLTAVGEGERTQQRGTEVRFAFDCDIPSNTLVKLVFS